MQRWNTSIAIDNIRIQLSARYCNMVSLFLWTFHIRVSSLWKYHGNLENEKTFSRPGKIMEFEKSPKNLENHGFWQIEPGKIMEFWQWFETLENQFFVLRAHFKQYMPLYILLLNMFIDFFQNHRCLLVYLFDIFNNTYYISTITDYTIDITLHGFTRKWYSE